MVHQHFMLVPVFTVAENVMLGVERTTVLGLLNRRQARKDVLELSARYGLAVDPGRPRRGPAGRDPAAGRDREGPPPRGEHRHLGRADRRS